MNWNPVRLPEMSILNGKSTDRRPVMDVESKHHRISFLFCQDRYHQCSGQTSPRILPATLFFLWQSVWSIAVQCWQCGCLHYESCSDTCIAVAHTVYRMFAILQIPVTGLLTKSPISYLTKSSPCCPEIFHFLLHKLPDLLLLPQSKFFTVLFSSTRIHFFNKDFIFMHGSAWNSFYKQQAAYKMLLSRIPTLPAVIFIIKPFCSYFKGVFTKNVSSFFRYYYHTFTYTQAVSYVPDLFWCCIIVSHFLSIE